MTVSLIYNGKTDEYSFLESLNTIPKLDPNLVKEEFLRKDRQTYTSDSSLKDTDLEITLEGHLCSAEVVACTRQLCSDELINTIHILCIWYRLLCSLKLIYNISIFCIVKTVLTLNNHSEKTQSCAVFWSWTVKLQNWVRGISFLVRGKHLHRKTLSTSSNAEANIFSV